jgi:hypothetical protein
MSILRISAIIITLFLCISPSLGKVTEVIIETSPVSCYDKKDGAIHLFLIDSTQHFEVTMYKYTPKGIPLKSFKKNDTLCFSATGLEAAKYTLEIKGSGGFSKTRQIQVTQPEALSSNKIKVIRKLSEKDGRNAILEAQPIGGVPPYIYTWNVDEKGKNSQLLENVGQGIFTCTINDSHNCGPIKSTILFNEHVMPDIIEE